MSAIWGCIDFSGSILDSGLPDIMTECTKLYKIDRTEHLIENNVYMACGLQYITKESRYEKLPCIKDGLYFSADCIIDNRQELIDSLGIDTDAADGEVLFSAWQKWGEDFGNYVIGLFSFAVYDRKKSQFYLYTDHTSSRCIHYFVKGSKVYFATLTKCITDAAGGIDISEKWLTACMSTNFPSMLLYEGLSPFENVFILPYGCGVKIEYIDNSIVVEKKRYWDPLNTVTQIKKFDDNNCRKMFREVHNKCVQDAIRTDGNIGILLSSGLDSSAIGCTAARMLNLKKKDLYSYTSIPLKEFDGNSDNKQKFWIDDESEGVKCICNHYKNIKPKFLECRGKSVLSYVEEFVKYLEFPGKALVNHVWMKDAYEMAREDGCRIVMYGSYGNMSISYGSLFENTWLMIKCGDIIGAVKQIFRLAEKEHLSKKNLLKMFVKKLFNNVDYTDDSHIDDELFKSKLVEKYNIRKEWENRLKREGIEKMTLSQRRNALVSGLLFQLVGLYETKDGLYNGILIRDPSKDKRMIELCLRLPFKCFAWNGVERRLVRDYLDDVVPDEIRLINRNRGRQSGDAVIRYDMYGLPNGEKTWDVLIGRMKSYFNIDKSIELLKSKTDAANLINKAKIMSCNYFLKEFGKDDLV